ncbi:hypothetical protein E2C01_015267 [Portunus trituberculatus]|uniref:Uncharacterized protein n=1 Tax=Portunus trituberculatus TaxID=210409 RepID=A0A5B7DMA2_PORTR|nr:hypothetical protein [Portunus trituberculatus]
MTGPAAVPAADATSTRDSCGPEGRLGELFRSPPQPQGYLQVKPRPRCHGMCGRVARTKVELKKAMMRSWCPPHTGAAFVHARLWEHQRRNRGKPEIEDQRGRTCQRESGRETHKGRIYEGKRETKNQREKNKEPGREEQRRKLEPDLKKNKRRRTRQNEKSKEKEPE